MSDLTIHPTPLTIAKVALLRELHKASRPQVPPLKDSVVLEAAMHKGLDMMIQSNLHHPPFGGLFPQAIPCPDPEVMTMAPAHVPGEYPPG